jgi:RNA polymerase sigma-70 factor (ECF subfamily)
VSGEHDEELTRRLREGDASAVDALYTRYRVVVFSFVLRLTGQRPWSEDIVQEAFLRLVRHAPRLEPNTRVGVWLCAVARNLYISQLRRAELRLQADYAEPALASPAHDSPFERAVASELEARLERAVQRLSLNLREVVILALIEGFSNDDVARILGLRPENVRQRVSRARRLLEAELPELGAAKRPRRELEQAAEGDDD